VSDNYYLSIVDHGRGTTGIAFDYTSKDVLTARELSQALQGGTGNGNWKVSLLHYGACLMAMSEQDYQVREYAGNLPQ